MMNKGRMGAGLWVVLYMMIFGLAQQLALRILDQMTMSANSCSLEKAVELVLQTKVPVVLALSALIGLPLYYLIVHLRQKPWLLLVWQNPLKASRIVMLFLLGMLLNQLAGLLLSLAEMVPALSGLFQVYAQSMEGLGAGNNPGQMILLMGIVVPIYEEVLFRGLIFSEFSAIAPTGLAILAQALLFGVWHGSLLQGIYAFVLGLILGKLYLKHRSVWAAAAVHCGFNTASYLLLLLFQ